MLSEAFRRRLAVEAAAGQSRSRRSSRTANPFLGTTRHRGSILHHGRSSGRNEESPFGTIGGGAAPFRGKRDRRGPAGSSPGAGGRGKTRSHHHHPGAQPAVGTATRATQARRKQPVNAGTEQRQPQQPRRPAVTPGNRVRKENHEREERNHEPSATPKRKKERAREQIPRRKQNPNRNSEPHGIGTTRQRHNRNKNKRSRPRAGSTAKEERTHPRCRQRGHLPPNEQSAQTTCSSTQC